MNKNIDGKNFPKYHDTTFGDPPPPMFNTFSPQMQIGADAMSQLITVTERLLEMLRKNMYQVGSLEDDALMAIREGREWMGESNSCENGSCRL